MFFSLIGGDPRAVRRRRDLPHPRHAAGRAAARERGRSSSGSGPGCSGRSRSGCFLARLGAGGEPGPGRRAGGLIVGFMGLIFGAGGLLALKLGERRRKRKRRADRRSRRRSPRWRPRRRRSRPRRTRVEPARAGSTACARQGALTEAEFETLKAKIVEERLMATEGSRFNPTAVLVHLVGDRARRSTSAGSLMERDLARPSRRLGRAGGERRRPRSPATRPSRCFARPTWSRRWRSSRTSWPRARASSACTSSPGRWRPRRALGRRPVPARRRARGRAGRRSPRRSTASAAARRSTSARSPTWTWSRPATARAGTCSSTSSATSARRRGPTGRRSTAARSRPGRDAAEAGRAE